MNDESFKITQQCEQETLESLSFIGVGDEGFNQQFDKYCNVVGAGLFGIIESDANKAKLCACLKQAVKRDGPISRAIYLGDSGTYLSQKMQPAADKCVKTTLYPNAAALGWQKESGLSVAATSSATDSLIHRIEFSCTPAKKLIVQIAWGLKPEKEQLFFGGGETDPDVVIALPKGKAEGKAARRIYQFLLQEQGGMTEDRMNVYAYQAQSDAGSMYGGGIILGNTKKMVGPIIAACLSTPNSKNPKLKFHPSPE